MKNLTDEELQRLAEIGDLPGEDLFDRGIEELKRYRRALPTLARHARRLRAEIDLSRVWMARAQLAEEEQERAASGCTRG